MTIISIAIHKGGSGKTTTALNLGAWFRDQGKKVLLVDMDPQSNLTHSLGFVEGPEPNLYDILRQFAEGDEVPVPYDRYQSQGMDVLPASLDLAGSEMDLVSVYGREFLLKQIIEPAKSRYDFILIDCPPAMGMLTVNALTASDHVLIPLQAEFLPLKGLKNFIRSLENIRKKLNPGLQVLALLITKYDHRKTMNREVMASIRDTYGDLLLTVSVRTNIALAQAQEQGMDIFTFRPGSHGAEDYAKAAAMLMQRLK